MTERFTDKQVAAMLSDAFNRGYHARASLGPQAWGSDVEYLRVETIHRLFSMAEAGQYDEDNAD